MKLRACASVLSCLVVGAAACSGSTSTGGHQNDDIVGGTSAAAYPEAVLVDLMKGKERYAACSGSLIAPNVVLTAGHCVHGISSWVVTAPAASGQRAKGTRGETYDWDASGEEVDPNEHDIGLVFLDAPIELSSYPKLASEPLASNRTVYNIGRIQDGQLSDSELFVSKSIKVKSAAASGFPYDYIATETIEPGDSGGPDVEPGSAPHTIVAVNSGAGGGTEVLARVDLVRDWILGRVAASGGSSSGGGKSPGGSTTTCAHDLCVAGAKLAKSCDPCVTQVCAADSYCCAHDWDTDCVAEAADICGASCGGSCGSVTSAGKCKGDELEYCDGGSLATADCASYGLACGYNPDAGEYDCL
jgi:V8-like Glu-specific endopeptidase